MFQTGASTLSKASPPTRGLLSSDPEKSPDPLVALSLAGQQNDLASLGQAARCQTAGGLLSQPLQVVRTRQIGVGDNHLDTLSETALPEKRNVIPITPHYTRGNSDCPLKNPTHYTQHQHPLRNEPLKYQLT